MNQPQDSQTQGNIPGMGPVAMTQRLSPPSTSMDPITNLIDQEIVGMVTSRLEQSKTWRRTRRLIWDRCIQNMKGESDTTGKEAWQSKTHMPLTSKTVEIVTSNLHQALLAPDMPIEYQTRRSDYDQLVRSINEVMSDDFDKCQAKVQLTDFIRGICLFGTSIGEVGYKKEYETVMVKNRAPQLPPEIQGFMGSMGIQGNEPFVPKQMLVKDHATITNVDIYDVYPQPRKPEIDKDMWLIVESKITNRELVMASQEQDPYYKYDNINDRLLEGSGSNRIENDPEKQIKRYALMDFNYYTTYLEPDREHKLLTFYGQIPLWYLKPELRMDKRYQYQSVPGVIKVVDDQWLIWKRISPWRDGEPPFFKGNYIRIPGPEGFYGIGVAELIIGLQVEKNEIRNSRMDNINLSMNKIIAVLKDLIPTGEWDRLRSEPGAIWTVKGVDDVRKAIQQIEFGNVTQDSWQASAEVDREAEEVTAANKVTQASGGGEGDAGGSTFRGQALNLQQASGRWMLYARMFEWTGFSAAMRKFYQRIYQFKDLKEIADILGPDRMKGFQLIIPEELDKVAKLVPLGTMTMENKGVKLAQMSQFAQQMPLMAGPLPPWFKALEFARKQAVEMGNQEPDQILFSDEEMQQYNQMKKMAAQEQMAMAQHLAGLGIPPQGPQSGQQQPQDGLLGPNGQPAPKSGQGANVPGGQPVAGNTVGPTYGMPRPAYPARGPGASPMDLSGRPMG